jgi:hypothetical protein
LNREARGLIRVRLESGEEKLEQNKEKWQIPFKNNITSAGV